MQLLGGGGGGGGGGGTVTSVGLTMPAIFAVAGSPIITSGTFVVTLGTQVAGTFFAGPAFGADAAPTFRAIDPADLPVVPVAKGGTNLSSYTAGDILYATGAATLAKLPIGTNGQVLTVVAGAPAWDASGTAPVSSVFGRTGAVVAVAGDYGPTLGGTGQTAVTTGDLLYGSAANTWSRLAAGTNGHVLTLVAGVPAWTAAGTGTVTSVALAAPSIFTVSGSPVTTSGTLTLTASCATGDIIYGSGTNTYAKRTIGSTGAVLIVSAGVPAWGVVTETWGGTNQTTYATGDMLYATGANTLGKRTIGGAGTCLVSSGTAPTWTTLGPDGGGTGLTTYTTGDILYASATNVLSKRGIGGAGIPLVSNGTTPAYAVLAEGGGGTNQTTYTTGQILYASGTNTLAKLNIGGNGLVLTVVAGVPAWAAAGSGTVTSVALAAPSIFSVSGSPVTTSGTLTLTAACSTGDVIYGSAANTYSKLAIGSTGHVLTVAAGIPSWAAVVCPATAFVTLTDGATITVTASSFPTGQCGIGKVTLGGNRTLSFSGGTAGQRIELWILQDATGGRTLAYDSSCAFATGLPSPTLTTTANAKDKQMWEYDDVAAKWHLMAINKGF